MTGISLPYQVALLLPDSPGWGVVLPSLCSHYKVHVGSLHILNERYPDIVSEKDQAAEQYMNKKIGLALRHPGG